MYRKILVPLDGSEQALKALDFAVDLAAKYDASLSLLHVITDREVPKSVRKFAEAEHMEMPPDWIYEQQVGEKILGKCAQQARDKGIELVETSVQKGRPAQMIVDMATATGIDIIVMGTRGLSDMQGLVMGSVAHKVSHLAPCTVMTVR